MECFAAGGSNAAILLKSTHAPGNVDILMNMKLRLILMTTFIRLFTVCFLFARTISTSNNCGSRVYSLPPKSTVFYFYPMALTLTTHGGFNFLPEYNK